MSSYTARTRTAVSLIRFGALCATFFTLPVYGIGLGVGMPASKLTFVGILDDWYDLRGTQTAPPDVKPALWAAFALAVIADILAVAMTRPGSRLRAVGRVSDAAACITAAICGELILAHVETNQSDNVLAGQTSMVGSMISVMMLLLILPNSIESIAVLNEILPKGD